MPPVAETTSPVFNVRTLFAPVAVNAIDPVPALIVLDAATVMLPLFETLTPVPVSLIAFNVKAPEFNKLIAPLVELVAANPVTAFVAVLNNVPVDELVVNKPPVMIPAEVCVS